MGWTRGGGKAAAVEGTQKIKNERGRIVWAGYKGWQTQRSHVRPRFRGVVVLCPGERKPKRPKRDLLGFRRKGRGNENKQNSMRVLYMSGGLGSEPGRCVDTSSCPRALYVPEYPSSADYLTFLLFLPVFFLFSSAFSSGILLSKEGHRGKKASCGRVTTVGPCKIVVNRDGASRNATVPFCNTLQMF